ncbi:CDP-glycerol:poly(glycerophosphate) glycerophosphotransferase [Xylanibacter ruminicola]|uniref:CDP-glycerol:poly(Glycerophosphate) glycerophosphotransferase n=1 Tax=Xylanibacter ruminicola TaxID=839 RepID=A0A1H4C4Y9_XYLRU|nr:CDP-glycerol glycerophosphotransferase family protein [Xylanibacter ruminicola]SEA55429.1 CDP-glycerol:poly(glycerophosphate) glycerophosphotransferase [Xylanibacter ruminicola]
MEIRERLVYILKHYKWIQYTYRICMSLFFRLVGQFFKIDKDLVLINSWVGKKYNDSPKVLFETMKDDHRFKNLKYVWAFEHPEKFDLKGAKCIKIDTWEYFKTALKAKVWITCVNIERGLTIKKNDTIYINTWHGAGTKKIGNACASRHDYDLSNVNMMLVQSDFEKDIFIRDFNCRAEYIRKVGFPRNDELFHITDKDRIKYRKQFNIPDGKKVILYAPTWRDSKDGGLSYRVEPPIHIEKWRERFGEEYVVLFRMHPFTTIFNMQYDDFSRDCSSYDNLNHILAITDVLITDYSTIVYDSAVAHIPFICFGFDYDRYYVERGFYYDLDKVYPGGVLRTEEEIWKRIEDVMNDVDKDKYAAFREKYIEAGGHATEMVLDELDHQLKD